MAGKSRSEMRDELLIELGMLLSPFRRLIWGLDERPSAYPYIYAAYESDRSTFMENVKTYTTITTSKFPGTQETWMREEYLGVWHSISKFEVLVKTARDPANWKMMQAGYMVLVDNIRKSIGAIPC